MTSWDFFSAIINGFPPVAFALLLTITICAVITFIVGFTRHGIDFIKHGLRQNSLTAEIIANLATKDDIARIEGNITKIESNVARLEGNMNKMETELSTIKINHFGHLRNFLTELTSILVDKSIITNENKARLDNQLQGM